MAYSINGNIGANSDIVFPTAQNPTAPLRLGTQFFGNDGRVYVFAKANAAIPASTAVCAINATTFLATASGGAYLSPNVALASGDWAWFGKAGV